MKILKYITSIILLLILGSCRSQEQEDIIKEEEDTNKSWVLVWSDDFNYEDSKLDEYWESQNGSSTNIHVLCSRWRENVMVSDGVLHLNNKKENKGGQEWTSGSIWTKEKFKYGKFECRYKYGSTTGLNNSFWIATRNASTRFEIDINEGKFPNQIDMNMHDSGATSEDGSHPQYPETYYVDTEPLSPSYTIKLESQIKTKKIRLISNHIKHFHIREFRVFPESSSYPNALNDDSQNTSLLSNFSKSAKISCSGTFEDNYELRKAENAIDGIVSTSWVSQREGQKYLQLEWEEEKNIGCIQFVNGWQSGDTWKDLVSDFKIEYWAGSDWLTIKDHNFNKTDLSADFHIYALEWNEKEIIWFFDGNEIRREKNDFCHNVAPVYLSSAIVDWAGTVSDEIDGTSLDVDWVKIYQLK